MPSLTYKMRIFAARCIRKMRRDQLKNRDFTLITSTCFGGVVYRALDLFYDSPTIATLIAPADFIRFCNDLRYYMDQPLAFYENPAVHYPCAHLGEGERMISIGFVHYHTPEEVIAKWTRRKERMHWDNIYIAASDGDGVTADAFQQIDPSVCRRMVVFTSQDHPELPYTFCLKSLAGQPDASKHMIVHSIFKLWPWFYEFNFVRWLNNEDDLRL